MDDDQTRVAYFSGVKNSYEAEEHPEYSIEIRLDQSEKGFSGFNSTLFDIYYNSEEFGEILSPPSEQTVTKYLPKIMDTGDRPDVPNIIILPYSPVKNDKMPTKAQVDQAQSELGTIILVVDKAKIGQKHEKDTVDWSINWRDPNFNVFYQDPKMHIEYSSARELCQFVDRVGPTPEPSTTTTHMNGGGGDGGGRAKKSATMMAITVATVLAGSAFVGAVIGYFVYRQNKVIQNGLASVRKKSAKKGTTMNMSRMIKADLTITKPQSAKSVKKVEASSRGSSEKTTKGGSRTSTATSKGSSKKFSTSWRKASSPPGSGKSSKGLQSAKSAGSYKK